MSAMGKRLFLCKVTEWDAEWIWFFYELTVR